MKKELLECYINKLKKEDIEKYLTKECVTYTESEINIIYNSIKNDYKEILNTNFMDYLSKHKLSLNEELYKKIIEKYNEYKKFIE